MKSAPVETPGLVDQAFMDARHKLLDIAAFLDRIERHNQEDDFRIRAFYEAIKCLNERGQRAKAIQMLLSDPTEEPIAAAHTKGASGAYRSETEV